MVTAKIENENSIVRIHDEFFDSMPERRMQHVNRIITEHYKRRYVNNTEEDNTSITGKAEMVVTK